MAAEDYVAPSLKTDAFHCPHCGAFAYQRWGLVRSGGTSEFVEGWLVSHCARCRGVALWVGPVMVYPDRGNAPRPNPDLPEDIKADFEEARSIVNRSPRGAAALLRLAVQKICQRVGLPGKNLDDDIARLVKGGLSEKMQKAFDTVRVVGNEQVHPGTIDIRDDPQMAAALFKMVNIVAEKLFTETREINEVYAALPEAKRTAIAERDGR